MHWIHTANKEIKRKVNFPVVALFNFFNAQFLTWGYNTFALSFPKIWLHYPQVKAKGRLYSRRFSDVNWGDDVTGSLKMALWSLRATAADTFGMKSGLADTNWDISSRMCHWLPDGCSDTHVSTNTIDDWGRSNPHTARGTKSDCWPMGGEVKSSDERDKWAKASCTHMPCSGELSLTGSWATGIISE